MTEVKNCFIIDKLENIGAYANLGPNFAAACALIAKGDFAALKPGENEIDGRRVYVNNASPEYSRVEGRQAEVHKFHFDIHVPLTCDEKIGLGVYDARVKGTYDEAGDTAFYAQNVDWYVIHKGEFCITWPVTCAHVPAVSPDEPKPARKLIFKILNP